MSIRKATVTDVPWICNELERFHSTIKSKHRYLPAQPALRDKVLDMIFHHAVFIKESESSPMGMIGGYIVDHPFNPDVVLMSETFWWVPPEFRGMGIGIALLEEFVNYGKSMADTIQVSLEITSKVSDNTLMRIGLYPFERVFVMEI